MSDRSWNTKLQEWVYEADIQEALDAAQLAITEYHNGDREWAERWLTKAAKANVEDVLERTYRRRKESTTKPES